MSEENRLITVKSKLEHYFKDSAMKVDNTVGSRFARLGSDTSSRGFDPVTTCAPLASGAQIAKVVQ